MIKSKKGFTLIELLVVIAIIGLLSTLAVVALNNARQKARDAKRVADIKQVQTALELHTTENGQYPACAEGATLCAAETNEMGTDFTKIDDHATITNGTQTGTTYMGLVPTDPSSAGDGDAACLTTSAAGCNPSYNNPVDLQGYELQFFLEGAVGSLPLGATCATESGIATGAC